MKRPIFPMPHAREQQPQPLHRTGATPRWYLVKNGPHDYATAFSHHRPANAVAEGETHRELGEHLHRQLAKDRRADHWAGAAAVAISGSLAWLTWRLIEAVLR